MPLQQFRRNDGRKVDDRRRPPLFKSFEALDSRFEIAYPSRLRRLTRRTFDPFAPVMPALRLIALAARGYQVRDFGNESRRPFFPHQRTQVIPFVVIVATVSTNYSVAGHPEHRERFDNIEFCRVHDRND